MMSLGIEIKKNLNFPNCPFKDGQVDTNNKSNVVFYLTSSRELKYNQWQMKLFNVAIGKFLIYILCTKRYFDHIILTYIDLKKLMISL